MHYSEPTIPGTAASILILVGTFMLMATTMIGSLYGLSVFARSVWQVLSG